MPGLYSNTAKYVKKKTNSVTRPNTAKSVSGQSSVTRPPASTSSSNLARGQMTPPRPVTVAKPPPPPYVPPVDTYPLGDAGGRALADAKVAQDKQAAGIANTGMTSTNTSMTDPLSGFASRYQNVYAPSLMQEPQVIARDALGAMGLGKNVQLMQAISDIAQVAPEMAFILLGGQGNAPVGNSDTINSMANWAQQQATPGGRYVDFNETLNKIMGSGPNDNLLGAYTNIADPRTSVANTTGLLRSVMQQGVANPYFQAALMAQLVEQGDQYQQKSYAGGNPGGFGQYLKGSPLNALVGG